MGKCTRSRERLRRARTFRLSKPESITKFASAAKEMASLMWSWQMQLFPYWSRAVKGGAGFWVTPLSKICVRVARGRAITRSWTHPARSEVLRVRVRRHRGQRRKTRRVDDGRAVRKVVRVVERPVALREEKGACESRC